MQSAKYFRIISLAIPSLIAIISLELVTVVMYNFGPLTKSLRNQLLWLTLQTCVGFVFAYISDRKYRKATLVISQLLGVIGGTILIFFDLEFWVVILIAATFNPLPVARAALLDNFPKVSSLRIVVFTFLAQAFPWILFRNIGEINFNRTVIFIVILMFLNLFLTIFLFKDNCDHRKNEKTNNFISIFKKQPSLRFILFAFICSEATFYLLLDFFEYNDSIRSLLSITSISTFVGMGIGLLYSRLPHLSLITLCYSVGAAAMCVLIFECVLFPKSCNHNLIQTMTQYSILGGLYLPFVTDAVIQILGPRHRALGSSLIEIGDTIAVFIAPIVSIGLGNRLNYRSIVVIFFILYVLATVLQRIAEKRRKNAKHVAHNMQ